MTDLGMMTGRLNDSWNRLRIRWEETKVDWDDSVRWDFEEQYWDPVESQVPATLRALEQLAQTISQARRSVR